MKIYKPALTQPGGQPDLRLPASRNVRKPFTGQPPSLCHLVMAAVGLENILYPALLWPHMEANITASPGSRQWPPSLLPSPMCPPSLWGDQQGPLTVETRSQSTFTQNPSLALCVLWRKSRSHHLALQGLPGPVLLPCHLPPVFIPATLIRRSSFPVCQAGSSEVSPGPLSPAEMGLSPWLSSHFCHLSLHQPHLPNHAINRNSLYPCAQQNCFTFSHLLII